MDTDDGRNETNPATSTCGLCSSQFIMLDSPSELWATEWGGTLVAKSAFVAVAARAGGYNHRVLIPEMHRSRHDPDLAHRFGRVVTGEAAALTAVLVAAALLMGSAS